MNFEAVLLLVSFEFGFEAEDSFHFFPSPSHESSEIDEADVLLEERGVAAGGDGPHGPSVPVDRVPVAGDPPPHHLEPDQLAEFGAGYLRDTAIHRQGAPFFLDKMPNNFMHIGLIRLILPNARIIDARRHPMACCFSGFKQLFAEGQEFSYDLQDIGRYYNDYVALMDHWDQVSPGSILRVYYENVVTDLESQVRRILDYCCLPFEDACLSFFDTDRAVRTASSEQVRQPIYRSGVEQWTNFQPYLEPLERVLAPGLENYPEFGD